MVKKIVLGTLLVGFISILVAGAVIRTIDKTGNVVEAQGAGRGHGTSQELAPGGEPAGQGRGAQGRADGGDQGQGREPQAVTEDWAIVEGTVVQAPAAGTELVIRTDDGTNMAVGTGPGYLEGQGFTVQAGERVQVSGYQQEGEIRAAQVTRLRDGATITLRDQAGRPMWAGGGQANRGQGGASEAGSTGGVGQAEVSEWVTVQGTVTSVDQDALQIKGSSGEQVIVENRPWWFAQEQGFSAQAGDQVSVRGFYDEDQFEVGEITDVTNGQTVLIREPSGRPLWAGRGRRSS